MRCRIKDSRLWRSRLQIYWMQTHTRTVRGSASDTHVRMRPHNARRPVTSVTRDPTDNPDMVIAVGIASGCKPT